MTSSTSPTTTEGGAGSAGAQSIVPIAAGVGGGVAALLLLLLTALIVAAIAVTLRKNKRELSEEYKGWQVHKSPFHQETSFLSMSYASWLEPSTWRWLQLLHDHDLFRILLSSQPGGSNEALLQCQWYMWFPMPLLGSTAIGVQH